MISSNDSIKYVGTTRIPVAVGATLATLVDLNALPNTDLTLMKIISGGTCEIIGCTQGVTLAASDLASLSGTGYPLASGEPITLFGGARFYLSNTGATSVVALLAGKTQIT